VFQHLSLEESDLLIDGLSQVEYEEDEVIITEGDFGNELYIIKEGFVQIIKGGIEIRKMLKGDYFGEQALLYDQRRTSSVIALCPTIC
jgi:cGMP-dependent protein kinase